MRFTESSGIPVPAFKMKARSSQRQQRTGQKARDRKTVGKPTTASPAEDLYRKIFDHSNDAILVIDPERDTIVDANPRACDMLGYTRDELLSVPISAIHPQEMAVLQAFAESVFLNGHGWTNELSCMTKSGQQLPAEISASSIEVSQEYSNAGPGTVSGTKHIIAMVRDITERRQAEAAERDLAIAEERNRLAREIHDSLAQGLTAIIWQLNAAEGPAEAGGQQALDSLDAVRNLAKECLQEARRSVWDLRIGPLKGVTLVEALQLEANKVSGVGIETSFDLAGEERVIPAGVEVAVLRICQEALANVQKHASASRVSVTLSFDDARVRLRISDDGIGFDIQIPTHLDKDRGGFGLISMRERAQLLGGELQLSSTIGRGTVVEADLPAH